jgi:IS30 family transposase
MFRRSGGVIPVHVEQLSPSQGGRLSPAEREEIALSRAAGRGVREIARLIGRDPATISRELARNTSGDGRYRASVAQQRAEERARLAGLAASPAKLATNLWLRREVQDRLRKNHSPVQIARRLREDFPNDAEMRVSHETIYQSLYIQGRGGLKRELVKHLRTGRSLRQPRAQGQARRAQRGRGEQIKDMINISDRPPEVADRAVPGHWEGDLITGADNRSAIGTVVERTTGYLILLHLPDDHGALAVQHAITEAMSRLPELLRKTLTWDQGIEMANHAKIAEATGLAIYFCDPHSPWQRGTNENTNGLLRQYFPKGTDLSIHGPGILEHVAIEMNNRPRARLDFRTPAEALDQLLCDHDKRGVADAG